MTAATHAERAAILAAVPSAAFRARGVASVLTELDGVLLDGAVVLDDLDDVFVRPLPGTDRAQLETWVGLFERRRNQLAHDVSGPATGVLAALETVLEYEPIPQSSRSILRDAREGMLRLSRLLGDRSAMLGSQPTYVEAPLTDLAARALEPIQTALDPQRQRLLVEITGEQAACRVDMGFLEGALSVLVTNAWKFRKGIAVNVRIEVARTDGALSVQVSDDGRGLDESSLRRAGEIGFSSRPSGVGLGLFLLRRAACQRGGAVLLEALEGGARAGVLVPEAG